MLPLDARGMQRKRHAKVLYIHRAINTFLIKQAHVKIPTA